MFKKSFVYVYLCSLVLICFTFGVLALNSGETYSSEGTANECSKNAVLQMAKIIYKEVGSDSAVDPNLNFYRRITTGSIILNNAFSKSGDTVYDKIYNLTNNNYEGYSNYKDLDFDTVTNGVSLDRRGELLYIARLVTTNKFNIPKNIIYQAADWILEDNGASIWDYTESTGDLLDVYLGYNGQLSNVDVFGNTINDTSKTYFRNLAESLKLEDYSIFNSDNICQLSLENEKKEYTIKFFSDNRLYHTSVVEEGSSVSAPTAPTKSGYSFKGWVDSDGKAFNFGLKVNSNLDLYAKWEKVISTYTINFYFDDKGTELYKKMTVEESTTLLLPPNPTKDGYVFKYWHDKDKNKVSSPFVVNGNRNLYAVWEKEINTYTVIFYLDRENKDVYKKYDVVEGENVKLPDVPTREGYDFKEWVDVNGNVFDENIKITKNLDLFASWSIIENNDKDNDIDVDDDNKNDEEVKNEENISKEENNEVEEKVENPKTGVVNVLWIFGTCLLAFIGLIFYFKRIKIQSDF